ncbi:hypothetical protein ENSA5_65050 [Enhygromyxa salina]|uniref:Lipoprotein n=1 Tax=Enhygromyxa salina TaxID=215803 RepID=A0A2S9XCA4_9BACT|nr:hypothetical protein [Enhygromyxa salina]PRP90486.1 hypothetical protein ENSA5_65050 [Enhygromyxa salina]
MRDHLLAVCLFGFGLAAGACDGPGTTQPDAGPAGDLVSTCAAGDASAGDQLIAQLRAGRLDASADDYAAHRGSLRSACTEGCAAACLEFAHNSWDPDEAAEFRQLACTHGSSEACSPDPAARCDQGELRACAEVSPDRVATLSAAGCAANDGRACSVQAWTRCTGVSDEVSDGATTCDELAIEAARKATQLVPEPEIEETLGVVYCHAGQPSQADASFAAACERGVQDACGRSCQELRPGRALVVRDSQQPTYAHILTLIALQSNVSEGWFLALSAMNDEELGGFVDMLEHFTPPLSEPGAKAKVPEDLAAQYPELVAALLRSPQVDAKKIKYWFGRLPEMSDEQRTNLMNSLRNQWWVIPGDESRTPTSFVEAVHLQHGGFGP